MEIDSSDGCGLFAQGRVNPRNFISEFQVQTEYRYQDVELLELELAAEADLNLARFCCCWVSHYMSFLLSNRSAASRVIRASSLF